MNNQILLKIKGIVDNIHNLKNHLSLEYSLPIEYLTIFSHKEVEFKELVKDLEQIGERSDANNGYKFNLYDSIRYKGEDLNLVRVRKPDIHRPELGCVDLKYNNEEYLKLRYTALDKGWDIILRKGYEMIELSSFDIPVLAYIVKDLL